MQQKESLSQVGESVWLTTVLFWVTVEGAWFNLSFMREDGNKEEAESSVTQDRKSWVMLQVFKGAFSFNVLPRAGSV